VKDLIKQHSKDTEELIKEANSEVSGIGTNSHPDFLSLKEIIEMQPTLTE
jgi:hypothetical protein